MTDADGAGGQALPSGTAGKLRATASTTSTFCPAHKRNDWEGLRLATFKAQAKLAHRTSD